MIGCPRYQEVLIQPARVLARRQD